MIGQGRETQEDNNLFYTCELIDYISRKTKNVRADVVNQLGRDNICKIYNLADVYHCDNIDRVSDDFIEESGIKTGKFDNVADCGYAVPSHWDIGKVYRRLIKMVVSKTQKWRIYYTEFRKNAISLYIFLSLSSVNGKDSRYLIDIGKRRLFPLFNRF